MNIAVRNRTDESVPNRWVWIRLRGWFATEFLNILLLIWMFLACCFPLFDTDLFWHLKTGEWILQNGMIPGYDLYTFTDFDKRWIDLHCGYQVAVAILYRIGGANLLILAKASLLTLALGVGCYSGGVKLCQWHRLLCWVLPAITISGRGSGAAAAPYFCIARGMDLRRPRAVLRCAAPTSCGCWRNSRAIPWCGSRHERRSAFTLAPRTSILLREHLYCQIRRVGIAEQSRLSLLLGFNGGHCQHDAAYRSIGRVRAR